MMLSRSNVILPTRFKPTSEFTRASASRPVDDTRRLGLAYSTLIELPHCACSAICYDIECHYEPELHNDSNSVQDVLLFATFCSTCGRATCAANIGASSQGNLPSTVWVHDHNRGHVEIHMSYHQSSSETVGAGIQRIAEHDVQFVGGFNNLNFDNRRIAHFYCNDDVEDVTLTRINASSMSLNVGMRPNYDLYAFVKNRRRAEFKRYNLATV